MRHLRRARSAAATIRAMETCPTKPDEQPQPGVRRTPWFVIAVLALAPLWLLGMFDRALWTPDEPREADIAWRMSQQDDIAIPYLASTPFLEKPPLSYWLSAAAIDAVGDSPGGDRLPNLLYALIVVAATGALAARMAGREAALIAALIAGSALLAYHVAIWLAPDAALLAGSAVALLGAYSGYRARAGARKFWGYTLMHAGAALGFMAKSAPGWLVPALALGSLIVWERRWAELRRWELYAGALLQALLIVPWIMAVAATPAGAASLRVFFWDNLAGRFTALAGTSAAHDYAHGHLNWWGKYFFELPAYLLPWTLLAVAALARARNRLRAGADQQPAATCWRFALCACLPLLVLLSLAATARDVYAAPAMLGFAVLVALWATSLYGELERIDKACLAGTRWILAVLALLCAAALAILAASVHRSATRTLDVLVALAVVALVLPGLRLAAKLQHKGRFGASLGVSYAAYLLAFALTARLLLPLVDRWQDLAALAAQIGRDSAGGVLAVLAPDETTIAMLDHPLRIDFTTLEAPAASSPALVAAWLRGRSRADHVLVMLPGHASGDISRLLGRWVPITAPDDGIAGALSAAGVARISARYELPQGRRYALLSSPSP
jgi:4-amino-4-deoxy-L-arabinose transferase-like glycosyltransferase